MSRLHPVCNSIKAIESDPLYGRRIRVLVGPFAGLQATVMERRGSSRVLMAVDSLTYGVFIEVDESQLCLADRRIHVDR
jgi:hypothetical protein